MRELESGVVTGISLHVMDPSAGPAKAVHHANTPNVTEHKSNF